MSMVAFSKNRHGRFQESNLFQQLFEQIVDRCMEAGLVEGEHLSVDGSFIPANASRLSRIAREQLPGAAHVKRTVREYLADLEQENPVEEPGPSTRSGIDDGSGFNLFDQGRSSAGTEVLQQLSDRQQELRHSWRSGYVRSAEPGKRGGWRDDHAVSGRTRALPTVGCCRHDVRER
jgi:hypothetical protein